jgi:hypothetical protein
MNEAMPARCRAAPDLVDAAREMPPNNQNFADFSHFTTAGAHLMAVHIAGELGPFLRRYETDGAKRESFSCRGW